jgi:hypothetical protein
MLHCALKLKVAFDLASYPGIGIKSQAKIKEKNLMILCLEAEGGL